MAITPDELPAVLIALRARVEASAGDVALAMAEAYREQVSRVTLRTFSHPPFTKTPSPPGMPPAWMTGRLAGSVRAERGPSGGGIGRASTAPHMIYSRIQEYGGDIYPVRAKYLRWVEDGRVHYSKHVRLPERPYMRPTTARMVADGSLSATAAGSFMKQVW